MSEEMENLFWELKQYLVQHSPKWDTLCDIEQYIIDLEQENKELKKYCCKRNDCGGRLKENHKPTDNEILTEFEKWLEEYKHEVGIDEYVTIQIILDKLQELKEGKK